MKNKTNCPFSKSYTKKKEKNSPLLCCFNSPESWRQNFSHDSCCFSFHLQFLLTTPSNSLRAAPRFSTPLCTRHIHVSPNGYPPFKCTCNTLDVRTLASCDSGCFSFHPKYSFTTPFNYDNPHILLYLFFFFRFSSHEYMSTGPDFLVCSTQSHVQLIKIVHSVHQKYIIF